VTLSFEQFRERMVDYLYEELTGDELSAFEAYLSESAEARRELSALQSTLRIAREALAQGSAEEPPARVRAALLEAAQAQVLEPQRAARTTRALASVAEDRSFWSRLRASWLLPTLGVAAAVALVVFGKNREAPMPSSERTAPNAVNTPAQGSPSSEREAPSAPAERSPSADEPAASPPTAAESEASARASGRLAEGARQPADRQRAATTRAARAPATGFAVPPPAWVAKRKSELPTQPKPRRAEAPAQPSAARSDALDMLDEPPANRDKRAAKAIGSAQGAPLEEPAMNDVLRMAPAAAPAAPAARAPAPTQDFVDDLLSDSLEGAKSVPADDAVAHSVTALLRRANEHVAAKRWPQAAADFRELLRRYPADARAPSWKKQLALVTQGLHDPP
jgi:hypothetical protein